MRSALCWDFMQRKVVTPYRRFGTTYPSYLQGPTVQEAAWSLKSSPIGYPETSVRDYHSTLRKIPKERRSYFAVFCRKVTAATSLRAARHVAADSCITRLGIYSLCGGKDGIHIVTPSSITSRFVTSAIYLYGLFAVVRRVFQSRKAENCKQSPINCGSDKYMSMEHLALWFDKGCVFCSSFVLWKQDQHPLTSL